MATPVLTRDPVRYVTEDEFLSSDEWDGYELVDGVPVEVIMGGLSAWIGTRVSRRFDEYTDDHGGAALAQDTPFKAWPDRPNHFRKPDAMYFAAGRFTDDTPPYGTIAIAPDIAVEVVSPADDAEGLRTKINEYLRAGVRLIWVVYPGSRDVDVIRASGENNRVAFDGILSGEEIMPGFTLAVSDLFRGRR